MNADELIAAINQQAPEHLPRASREFLQRYEVVLWSGPYYQDVGKIKATYYYRFDFLKHEMHTGLFILADSLVPHWWQIFSL